MVIFNIFEAIRVPKLLLHLNLFKVNNPIQDNLHDNPVNRAENVIANLTLKLLLP